MGTIAEITQPRFKCLGIIFLDGFPVSYNARGARDGSPFARRVEERDVNMRVGLEVIGFAGFRVGVEDEIDTAILLRLQLACEVNLQMKR